jgi:hypothetical protein
VTLNETQKVIHKSKIPIVLMEFGLDEDHISFGGKEEYDSPEEFKEDFTFFGSLFEAFEYPEWVNNKKHIEELFGIWRNSGDESGDAEHVKEIELLEKRARKALTINPPSGQERFFTAYSVEYDPGTLAILFCTPKEFKKLQWLSGQEDDED